MKKSEQKSVLLEKKEKAEAAEKEYREALLEDKIKCICDAIIKDDNMFKQINDLSISDLKILISEMINSPAFSDLIEVILTSSPRLTKIRKKKESKANKKTGKAVEVVAEEVATEAISAEKVVAEEVVTGAIAVEEGEISVEKSEAVNTEDTVEVEPLFTE